MTTDEELLRAYARGCSETAFTQLVQRHLDLVYSTALRIVGEPQLAQDIAQAVFVHLSRKVNSIHNPSALPGWLYRITSTQAANAIRAERRRRQREKEALKMNSTSGEESSPWEEIAPLLEEAMQTLARRDQDAVVLRFFHGQSLRAVGEALKLSEDAAQKRLSRALEKLRAYFARRGVRVSVGALATGLATHAIQAAPAGISGAISSAVIMSGTAVQGASTVGFAKLALTKGIVMTTTQKIIVIATVSLSVGTGIFEAHRVAQMRTQLREAERQVQPVSEQANQLRQERDEVTARLKEAQARMEQLQRDTAEIHRLRGEVALLRKDAQELATLKKVSTAAPRPTLPATDAPPSESASAELAARAAWLKQHLEQRPERRIPELQLATEKDWLEAAKIAKTDSDIDTRKGLSLVRTLSKMNVADLLRPALVAYTEANNGNLPTDLAQLKPFMSAPVDDTILQRYEVLRTGNTGDPGFNPYQPVIRDRSDARIDTLYDASVMISLTGGGGGGGPNAILPKRPGSVSSKDGKVFTRIGPDGSEQTFTKTEGTSPPNP